MSSLCAQCGQLYLEQDNRDDACIHHPGRMLDCDSGRLGVGLPLDIWECCSRQVETNPFDVPGCARGRHVAAKAGEPWSYTKAFEEQERVLAEALRGHVTRWGDERIALAERRTIEFLRGSFDPGPIRGRLWRDLLADVRVLGDDRLTTMLQLLADPQYPVIRRQALVPLLRLPQSKAPEDRGPDDDPLATLLEPSSERQKQAAQQVPVPSDGGASSETSDVWGLDRLFAAFPALRPERASVASVPLAPVSETARVEDEDTGQEAEITLALVPSDEFVVRLDVSLPGTQAPHEELAAQIARGVLKAALHRVTPPALACRVSIQHVTCTAGAATRLLHAAAYRAFGEASRLCGWRLSAPFPDVAITPGESIGAARERVVRIFAAAGFKLAESLRAVPASLATAVAAFSFYTGVEGGSRCTHLFFVCPQPWTPQSADFRTYRREVEYDYLHDGELSEVHMLSAHPPE